MEEIKIFDGSMSLDESNDVIGLHSHKYAKNGVFKGNAPETHFTSIKGNTKQNNTLVTNDCKIVATAKVIYDCKFSADVKTLWECEPLTATARWIVCEPFGAQAKKMFYYYEMIRCDGQIETPVKIGRHTESNLPLGIIYAGGTFQTYVCRQISSAGQGPYLDRDLYPTEAPAYDYDLTNPSYIRLDIGDCHNCTYCNPAPWGWGGGYSATSPSEACYNRLTGTNVGKFTFYTQCTDPVLDEGSFVYASANMNNPTGVVAPGYYSWGNPANPGGSANVWYVSSLDNPSVLKGITIGGITYPNATCDQAGWPPLTATYTSGCATPCVNDGSNGLNGTGFVNISAMAGGNYYQYRWTITNPAGTTSSLLTIEQDVNGITYNLPNGRYYIRLYDSRMQTFANPIPIDISCQCCVPFAAQAVQLYTYYNMAKCDGSGTIIGRSIEINKTGTYYLGGPFVKSNCASITSTTTNSSYNVDIDSLAPANGCNDITKCTSSPKSYGCGYGTTKALACYYAKYGYENKITLYTYADIPELANTVQVWTNSDVNGQLSGYPSTSYYYAYYNSSTGVSKVWSVDSSGILSGEENCSGYTIAAPTASYTTGCTGDEGTGYITVNSWSGGVGTGYFAQIYAGNISSPSGTLLAELYSGNQTLGSLANGDYTMFVGDYRRDTFTVYHITINCTPSVVYYLWNATSCETGYEVDIKTTNNLSSGNTYRTGTSNTQPSNCYTINYPTGTTGNASGALTLYLINDCYDTFTNGNYKCIQL